MGGDKLGTGTARQGLVKATVSEFPYWGHFKSFKVKNGYLCGVCRRSYTDDFQAKTCVINCTLPYAQYSVDTLVRGMKTRYRCPFCYREYLDNDNATTCLARCKKHIFSETGSDPYLEASRSDLAQVKGKTLAVVSREPRRESTTFSTRTSQNSSSPSGESHNNSPAALKVVPQTSNSVSKTGTEAPSKAAAVQEEKAAKEKYDPNVTYREAGQKVFTRADARYLCGACHAKYFTKTEAEQCFHSHPLKPEV